MEKVSEVGPPRLEQVGPSLHDNIGSGAGNNSLDLCHPDSSRSGVRTKGFDKLDLEETKALLQGLAA